VIGIDCPISLTFIFDLCWNKEMNQVRNDNKTAKGIQIYEGESLLNSDYRKWTLG
jgi:hypothetical protein